MAWLLLAGLALFGSTVQAQAEWPTLREVAQKHGIDPSQFDDADRRITSFEVTSDSEWFAIAYYWQAGELLPPELRLRTLDKRSGRWRFAVLDASDRRGGSAVRLSRSAGWVYLVLHMTPSAGDLIVLTEALHVRKHLAGWTSLVLPDGRVVYENNMVHFAPYHAASVSLYDPRTDRDVRLYPIGRDTATIESPEDRFVVSVKAVGIQNIEISVKAQRLRWVDNARTEPSEPERKYTITCSLATNTPACTQRKREG
jgi:hypothetical protein